jgi:hypothetical protein
MLEPKEVSAMLRLNELEWGAKRIAREFGISCNTAKELHRGGRLDAVPATVAQEGGRWPRGLAEGTFASSSRQPHRQELAAEARATVRFETPPGKQMQIDFGDRQTDAPCSSGLALAVAGGGQVLLGILSFATTPRPDRQLRLVKRSQTQGEWQGLLTAGSAPWPGVP